MIPRRQFQDSDIFQPRFRNFILQVHHNSPKNFYKKKRVCWGAFLRYCHLDFDETKKNISNIFLNCESLEKRDDTEIQAKT